MRLLDIIHGEQNRRRQPPDPLLIMIKGGLPEGEFVEASFGNAVLHREAAEALGAFASRAAQAAKQAGAEIVVIGGLPEAA